MGRPKKENQVVEVTVSQSEPKIADPSPKELSDEQYTLLLALAMRQIEDHLRYCSRWKLKATVARDKIQATLQEVLQSVRQGTISELLNGGSEAVYPVKKEDRVNPRSIGHSRGVSVDFNEG